MRLRDPPAGERTIKARAELHISGDRYEPEGHALVEITERKDSFLFSWKAVDSADDDIAGDSRSLAFTSMDNPRKPHEYLEQFISTNIQKTQLKGKNRLKVVKWDWIER
ncbi:MAG: hypothetical protein WCL50_10190 [Spirochaetota bacterium]